ncbi:MAG: glutathione peroxidase [Proteobacteria bacterium SG_bin4]|nr:MAG: glutathione peroxidase [Proteobacteria bacterium SG_bin4]
MRILLFLIMMFTFNPTYAACKSSLLDQNFRKLAGTESVNLCEAYAGKVLLIVNTASKCGYTPQYEGLEQLYEKYRQQGLVVLGFPSNDFMGQEPGTEEQIRDFCHLTYDVKFPMFEKTLVKKEHAHPFYVKLAELSGTYPTWNFQKYLIGRDGQLITHFSPHTQPLDPGVITAIEQALQP